MRGCCLPRRSLGDNRTKAGSGGRRDDREASMRDETVFLRHEFSIPRKSVVRIAFSSEVGATIQHFNESRQRSEMFF
jgi:hypothetical protein